jgi:hypothetical protein
VAEKAENSILQPAVIAKEACSYLPFKPAGFFVYLRI